MLVFCALLLFPPFFVAAYYLFFGVLGAVALRRRAPETSGRRHKFVVLIPAHQEERGIADTLRSCGELTYPADRHEICVVADNCTDRTAEIARDLGARCLERFDDRRRGKGYALQWALEQIEAEDWDAVVILDADCRIEPPALDLFDSRLEKGEIVLQANDASSNPDASVTSYAVSVGNFIENELFYAPKSRCGLAVFLRGTGMVIHRRALEACPWRAETVVEDVEYSLQLFARGIAVKFVPEARVESSFPVDREELSVQRRRWGKGNLPLGASKAPFLIARGLFGGNRLLLDAGLTLLTLSRPLVLLWVAAAVLAVSIAWVADPGRESMILVVAAALLVVAHGAYFGLGIILLGLNRRRALFLLGAPIVVLRLVAVSLAGLFGAGLARWERRPDRGAGDRP